MKNQPTPSENYQLITLYNHLYKKLAQAQYSSDFESAFNIAIEARLAIEHNQQLSKEQLNFRPGKVYKITGSNRTESFVVKDNQESCYKIIIEETNPIRRKAKEGIYQYFHFQQIEIYVPTASEAKAKELAEKYITKGLRVLFLNHQDGFILPPITRFVVSPSEVQH